MFIGQFESVDRKGSSDSNTGDLYPVHGRGSSPRAKGQPWWEIHPSIKPEESDIRIIKYHADSFLGTDLQEQLQKLAVKTLVITGVQTEYCVDTMCRTAVSNGYTCELVSDGHSTYDSEHLTAGQIIAHHNEVLKVFASVKPTTEIEFEE